MIPHEELPDALRLSVGRLARRLRQHARGGLTPSQRSVLATLARHGPMSMSSLADHEGISRPSATRSAARLVDRGLVVRRADAEDARVALVELSERGQETILRSRAERTAYLASRLQLLTSEERDVLAEATRIIDRILQEEP